MTEENNTTVIFDDVYHIGNCIKRYDFNDYYLPSRVNLCNEINFQQSNQGNVYSFMVKRHACQIINCKIHDILSQF